MVVWLKHLELFKEVSTSLFQFSYLSVFGGAVENMIKKKKSYWCFIESVCLLDLSDSIWCFLLHFYLSSITPLPPKKTPSLQIWLPVSPSDFQRLQSMKQRFWTQARFSFSDLPVSLPSISVSLSVFVVSFSFPGSVADRHATGN